MERALPFFCDSLNKNGFRSLRSRRWTTDAWLRSLGCCDFCEVTLGAMEYEMQQSDSVIKKLDVNMFELDVAQETADGLSCISSQTCVNDAKKELGGRHCTDNGLSDHRLLL